MLVNRHPDAASFLERARAFLESDEIRCNLPGSTARLCLQDPGRFPGRNYFATLEDGGEVIGVVVMTPPYRLQFYAPPEAAVAVAKDLQAGGFAPPGVHGPEAGASAFAAQWCAPRSLRANIDRRLRAFSLASVTAAERAPGEMRLATAGDADLVAAWYRGFHDESGIRVALEPPEDAGRRAIRERRMWLWEAGAPVSQAAVVGVTPNGRRIGAVYTPPGCRRNGYATALVAALSQAILGGGASYCSLFTDLANPISNSIYPTIGYRPIGDFLDIDFA